jgi:hypothetical protein
VRPVAQAAIAGHIQRLVSVFRQGWITVLVTLLNQRRLPLGRFVPEPWPQPD